MYQRDSLFNSVMAHDVKKLREIFKKYGNEIRMVGVAVRDVLMGKQPKHLDFATTASVLHMKEMFGKENLRMVNSKDEEHGTIKVLITGQAFEIITVNEAGQPTNGYWIQDDFDGHVHDHFGGYDDLKNGKVRVIGNADRVTGRQHLRILRYFRFHSQFAEDPGQDKEGLLQTYKNNAVGLRRVTGERVWKELKIILQEKSRNVVIKAMVDIGVGPSIGILSPNLAEFQNVSYMNKDTDIQPASLLAALFNDLADLCPLQSKLTLPKEEMRLMKYIITNRENTSDDSLLPYLKLIYSEKNLSEDIVIKHVTELFYYKGGKKLLNKLQEIPKFPIERNVLKRNRGLRKKEIQKYELVVKELVEYWYMNHYDLSTKELQKMIPKILRKYN